MKNLVLALVMTATISAVAGNAPKEPVDSIQFTTTVVNAKTGKQGSYHHLWVDGDRARIEEYGNPTLPLSNILLTDGNNGYMYTPRSKNATVFSGIHMLAGQASAFVTEANMQRAYGPLVKPQSNAAVDGKDCRVYKIGGLMAWFDSASGFGVKYGSAREASTAGGTYFSDIKVPADKSSSLYTLPSDAHINNPGFVPGIGGK